MHVLQESKGIKQWITKTLLKSSNGAFVRCKAHGIALNAGIGKDSLFRSKPASCQRVIRKEKYGE